MAKKEIAVISDEPVASSNQLPQVSAENRIFTIRGIQVIVDRDLAEFYGVETKRLNQQANRNRNRFPQRFRFQLSKEEKDELVANCNRFEPLKHSSTRPYAYTEQGVSMLSAVLHTPYAIEISVKIMDAFVAMRNFLMANAQVFQRLDRLEIRQLETDHKIEQVFAKLEEGVEDNKQCIFFEGQVYDAYDFICNLIKSAAERIVLVDNYVDYTVLTMLDKREHGVDATIYTQKAGDQFKLDIAKHDAQYPHIPVWIFKMAHDRFLIIDDRVYHVGASIKDLGKKWFAVSLMEAQDANAIITKLQADSVSV